MSWRLETVTAATAFPVEYEDARNHLRLDGYDDRAFVESLIARAVGIAETETDSTIAAQTLRVTHFDSAAQLILPRGPVRGIVSVTADGSSVASANYKWRTAGSTDYLFPLVSLAAPVVVTYTAGYSTCPAALTEKILLVCHILYEHRGEDVTELLGNLFKKEWRTPLAG